jgi:hypothetical protein
MKMAKQRVKTWKLATSGENGQASHYLTQTHTLQRKRLETAKRRAKTLIQAMFGVNTASFA